MRLQFWEGLWQVLRGMDVVDDAVKELLHPLPIFGRGLAKTQSLLSGLSDAFLPGDCPLLLEIGLIPDQDADSFDLTMFPKQF